VQERYNTDWVSQNNLGIVLRSFSRVERAVATMLDTARLREFHASIARLANRAVFELPDLLEVVIRRDADLRAERPASLPAARTDNLGFGGQLNLAPV